MVKIFEVQHQLNDISNHQSRVIEYESFQEYLQNVNEKSLPKKRAVGKKYVNHEQQAITFYFEHLFNDDMSVEFVHFAKVIEE